MRPYRSLSIVIATLLCCTASLISQSIKPTVRYGSVQTPRRITFSPEHESMPAWEPGSDRIAYRIGGSQFSGGEIGFVLSNGAVERTAAVGPSSVLGFLTSPSWVGATGLLMVAEKVDIHEYLSFDTGQAPFVRTVRDGSDDAFTRKLIALPGFGSSVGAADHIRVSRDGSTVAWRVTGGGSCSDTRIRVASFDSLAGQNADDFGEVVVSGFCSPNTHELFVEGFALTPDGSRLVLSRPIRSSTPDELFPPSDLFLYTTSGGGGAATPLTTSGATDGFFNEFPDVSPDGTQVVFARRDPAGIALYTIDLDGSNLTRITDNGGKGAREPSWSPDGRQIAFSSLDRGEVPENLNIYVVDLEEQAGPFLPPTPDAAAFRSALVDSDFDDIPEPGSDARLIVERTGNRVLLYQSDTPQRIWEIVCSDPHPISGRFQACVVTPPEVPEPNSAWQRLVRFFRRTVMGIDARRHTISVSEFDSSLRSKSFTIESEISAGDVRTTSLARTDSDGDGVLDALAFSGFLFLPTFEASPLLVDITNDGNPDYAGWPITFQGGRYFTPLADSDGDGIPDSVLYDFDRNGRVDPGGVPTFADAIAGPIPGSPPIFLNFAQFGKGEAGGTNLGSQIALFNLDTVAPADVSVEILGDQGTPLTVSLNGEVTQGTTELQIPAGGLRLLETDQLGDIVVGSVRVTADRAVAGNILFGGDAGVAGVGLSQVLDGGFAAIVDTDTASSVRAGIAIRNLENQTANVVLNLYDSSTVPVANGQLTLAASGHAALFLDEIEWSTPDDLPLDLSLFSGILEGEAVGRLSATVLQTLPGEISTLPVAPLSFRRATLSPTQAAKSHALGAGPPADLFQKLYFAQFGDGDEGASIRSRVFLLNLSPEPAQVELILRDDSGQPLSVDLNGQLAEGQFELVIPPGGLQTLETDGIGNLVSGSVTVCSDQYLAGVVQFAGDVGTAGVGASPLIRHGFWAPIQTNEEESTNTGVAVMNLDSAQVTLQLQLFDTEGQLLATAELVLPAFGHRALFVDEISWSVAGAPLNFSDFSGLIQTRAEGRYSATVIRTSPGVFATQPVVPTLN